MPPSQAQLDALRELFEIYRELPRHLGDENFNCRLDQLQRWEYADMRERHATHCVGDAQYSAVLNYYLDNLHDGLPLDGMMAHGPEGLDKAKRMGKAFELFANAIEFSVLSAVIQDRLVEKLDGSPITEESYQNAQSKAGDLSDRLRRLELLSKIGQQVAPHLRSRLIYTGFRLLKGLYRQVGMAEIHERMDAGFKQLRQVDQLAERIKELGEVEQQRLIS